MSEELLRKVYGAFNARNADAALALMQPAVEWAKGEEGGFVRGQAGVRELWARQWKQGDSRIETLSFSPGPDGRLAVDVRYFTRRKTADVFDMNIVRHVFRMRAGLIDSMEARTLETVIEANTTRLPAPSSFTPLRQA